MLNAFKRILTLRYLLAVALIFWCAGAGCMMVSYARGTTSAEAAMPTDHAMMGAMNSHACCKAKQKTLKRTVKAARIYDQGFTEFSTPLPANGSAMSCCPLTSGSLVVASRSQTDDAQSDLRPPHAFSLNLQNPGHIGVTVPLRLPNRARSYLLDCAFLI